MRIFIFYKINHVNGSTIEFSFEYKDWLPHIKKRSCGTCHCSFIINLQGRLVIRCFSSFVLLSD